ncbi:hypothetical protein PIIN_05672 [Serendipita indica DSM 11827]|uniref:Uncharacterized protein n=1 Tax=Serendipita indica (strain DSM 11827) TaxID=1109443 RepID=G4TK91_SERID|nr:hypothetical protein PIIN_05672 [Serendipita indica DSM 11827]
MGILDPFQRIDALIAQYQPETSNIPNHLTSAAFVDAVANAPSTDFIRAANPSQAAVYNVDVNQTALNRPNELEKMEIKRKTIGVATPLKKGEGRKPRRSRVAAIFDDENDPEVPLRAALKLIDLYPNAVSSDVKNQILEWIEDDKAQAERIRSLAKPKQHAALDNDEAGRLSQIEDEIRQLEDQNVKLRQKLNARMQAEAARHFDAADDSMMSESSPIVQRTIGRSRPLRHRDKSPDGDETVDFNRLNLVDNSLLMETDTPDISQLMAQTPMKLDSSGNWEKRKAASSSSYVDFSGARTPPRTEEEYSNETPRAYGYDDDYGEEAYDESAEVEPEDADETVLLQEPEDDNHVLGDSPINVEEPLTNESSDEKRNVSLQSPEPVPQATIQRPTTEDDLESAQDASKMRSFTTKIWSIAGDVLVPGNQYEASKGDGTEPTPTFRETKQMLQSISKSRPSSVTPDDVIRILTASLLYYLTGRTTDVVGDSGDAFSSGTSEAKDLLNKVIDENGWDRTLCTKVIFMWTGKRLLKSEGGRKIRCIVD